MACFRPLVGFLTILLIVSQLAGCGDFGNNLPDTANPKVIEVRPDSGRIGDSVRIMGTAFGTARGSSTVRFGNIEALTYVFWSDTLIVTTVPQDAATGALTVNTVMAESNPVGFTVPGTAVTMRSFTRDILPRLSQNGCVGCHGGSGGLYVDTRQHLLQGGSHGPAIVPGDADASLLIQKISVNPPFGSRMPPGGSVLDDGTIQILREWIDQGALDN